MKKIGLAVLSAFVIAGVAWAFSSSQFKTQADTYVNNTCGNPTLLNSQAALCYSVLKGEELDTSVSSLQTQVNGLNTKQLYLYDGNNNELGLAGITSPISYFYDPSMNLMVYLTSTSSGNAYVNHNAGSIYFTSSNCTGQAYDSHNLGDLSGNLQSPGVGSYYGYAGGSQSTQSINSELNPQGVAQAATCVSSSIGNEIVYPVQPVTIPFSDPITLPFQLKYQ